MSKPWKNSKDLDVLKMQRVLEQRELARQEKLQQKMANTLMAPGRNSLFERSKEVDLKKSPEELAAAAAEEASKEAAAAVEDQAAEAEAAEVERRKVEEEEEAAAAVARGE